MLLILPQVNYSYESYLNKFLHDDKQTDMIDLVHVERYHDIRIATWTS